MSKNYEEVTFFHVLHSKQDDKWHVKEGNGGTISAYPSKDDAIEKSHRIGRSNAVWEKASDHPQNKWNLRSDQSYLAFV